MSLSNLTVAITSSRRGIELCHIVKSFGGIPYLVPTVGIIDAGISMKEVELFINNVINQPVEYFVFMTGLSVHYLFRAASILKLRDELVRGIRRSTVISRGNKPSFILRSLGILTNIEPGPNTAGGILKVLKSRDIKGKRIAVISNGNGSEVFKDELELEGSRIFDLQLYSYFSLLDKTADSILKEMGYKQQVKPTIQSTSKLIYDIMNGAVHVITFTSPPSVSELFRVSDMNNNLFRLRSALNEQVIVASVGPSTSEALRQNAIAVDVMPEINKMGPMIKALSDYVSLSMNTSEVTSKIAKILKNLNKKDKQKKRPS
jgi:uroporphyrinogen-III synthase